MKYLLRNIDKFSQKYLFRNVEIFAQKYWNICSDPSVGGREPGYAKPKALGLASPTVAYLIFVTYPTNIFVEKKFVMWRNFRFLCITNMEKSDISPHLVCVWCGEYMYNFCCFVVQSGLSWITLFFFFLRLGTIYALLCGDNLNQKFLMSRRRKTNIMYAQWWCTEICIRILQEQAHRLQLSTYSFKIRTHHLHLMFFKFLKFFASFCKINSQT